MTVTVLIRRFGIGFKVEKQVSFLFGVRYHPTLRVLLLVVLIIRTYMILGSNGGVLGWNWFGLAGDMAFGRKGG